MFLEFKTPANTLISDQKLLIELPASQGFETFALDLRESLTFEFRMRNPVVDLIAVSDVQYDGITLEHLGYCAAVPSGARQLSWDRRRYAENPRRRILPDLGFFNLLDVLNFAGQTAFFDQRADELLLKKSALFNFAVIPSKSAGAPVETNLQLRPWLALVYSADTAAELLLELKGRVPPEESDIPLFAGTGTYRKVRLRIPATGGRLRLISKDLGRLLATDVFKELAWHARVIAFSDATADVRIAAIGLTERNLPERNIDFE